MRASYKFVFLAALALLVVLLMGGVANASTASIRSDRPDYAPGDEVTLIGAGWQPGENVAILVTDDTGWPVLCRTRAGGRGRRLHR